MMDKHFSNGSRVTHCLPSRISSPVMAVAAERMATASRSPTPMPRIDGLERARKWMLHLKLSMERDSTRQSVKLVRRQDAHRSLF